VTGNSGSDLGWFRHPSATDEREALRQAELAELRRLILKYPREAAEQALKRSLGSDPP
jgi:hypothetical protein